MDYTIITLVLAAVLNLVISILVTARGWKNAINKYFAIMTFFNVLWSLGLLFFKVGNNYEIVRFFGSFVYFASLLVVLNLFYFTIHFPFKIFHFSKFWQNILTSVISFFSLYFIFFYRKFTFDVGLVGINTASYEPMTYLLFSVILSILMLLSIIFLFIKYLKADLVFRNGLLLVLVGVIFGVLAGCSFNLYAMYFDNFNNYHFGPLFTLAINFVVFYLIFLKKDKKLEY